MLTLRRRFSESAIWRISWKSYKMSCNWLNFGSKTTFLTTLQEIFDIPSMYSEMFDTIFFPIHNFCSYVSVSESAEEESTKQYSIFIVYLKIQIWITFTCFQVGFDYVILDPFQWIKDTHPDKNYPWRSTFFWIS